MIKLLAAASCVALLAATGAKAQSPLGYDCRVPQIPGLVGAIVGLAQTQQRAACQQAAEQAQLRAAWEQQHQRDVAAAQQAAQQAAWAEQQRQAEARRQADIKQAEAQERARQVAQKAAEDAPDNACRSPDTARAMMKSLNDAHVIRHGESVIDMEHVTTVRTPSGDGMACHVTLVFTNEGRVKGTFSFQKNIVGDPIFEWKTDY
jgi:hypothetical protein